MSFARFSTAQSRCAACPPTKLRRVAPVVQRPERPLDGRQVGDDLDGLAATLAHRTATRTVRRLLSGKRCHGGKGADAPARELHGRGGLAPGHGGHGIQHDRRPTFPSTGQEFNSCAPLHPETAQLRPREPMSLDRESRSEAMGNSVTDTIGPLLILAAVFLAGWRSPLAAQAVGEVFRDCDLCPEMVVVPPGSFMMGSPDSEEGRYFFEGPQHRVTIDSPFAVGVYEVTFEEWDACVRAGGCGGHDPRDLGYGRGRRPVIGVSWDDAWAYADWLTERTGEEYRLLSEAEWEYAARAGTETARYWGDSAQQQCQYANGYDAVGHAEHRFEDRNPAGCRDRQANTAPVGSYRPNAFGLYDVLGNVWEWVDDCWNDTYEGAPMDGSPRYTGHCSGRVVRGGSWFNDPRGVRSADRSVEDSGRRFGYINGIRLARTMN